MDGAQGDSGGGGGRMDTAHSAAEAGVGEGCGRGT